ncbi:MATE family efflux transporter [Bacillus massiliglaciei]|uniref:MATE family efflux transporter n=1 Tax=Bacillus massiliglaciei TaxID=1816693 RepID=UPI000AD326FA|nr:MATE family efflux transporter [Bacillus massiliglaciei]
MKKTTTLQGKASQLASILFPILITQVGLYLMTFFDVMMSGQYSTEDVAGVSIGSSLWTPVYTGLSGILIGLTPIVSQLIGAGKGKNVSFSVIQAVYLSTFLALVLLLIGSFVLNPLLNSMGLEQPVREVAFDYLIGLAIGIVPLFIYNALRSFIDALGQTKISMIITLLALPVNIVLNYLLIFGKFGFPELGGAGAGYATAITYWIIAAVAFFIVKKVNPFHQYRVFHTFFRVSFKEWKAILAIGVPIGLSIFFETSIFSAVTLLMSNYDTVTIASHQIALNFASLLYMMPLSTAMALTIIVSFETGARRLKDAKQYGLIGIGLAVAAAILSAAILFFCRDGIAGLYTKDSLVIAMSRHFLLYAIFFQVSDAIQAPIQGILRGYKDVNVTFYMSLISYWIIGLPSGYYFANYTDWGPYGYWLGLILGLAIGALTLGLRLIYIQKRMQKQQSGAM